MRSAVYVVSLAVRRLRRRDGGALPAALGIAAAGAVLAGILVGATVAKDRSVAQDVERLPAASRAVRASWFGVPAGREEAWPTLDRQARRALAPLPAGAPIPIVLVRESTIGGAFVGLAAVDGLAPHVVLRSGRLPRACTPERCEVLRLRGVGRLPDVPGLRVVQVGTASLRSRQLFGDFLAPTDNALADAQLAPALAGASRYHLPAPGPLVVAEGVAGLVSSPVLAKLVPQLQLGPAALRRDAAALGDRRAHGRCGQGPCAAPGELLVVVGRATVAGASRRGGGRDGGRQAPAARRRRGRRAPRRVRRPRRRCAPAGPRRRPTPPHVARRAALAARAAHRHRERRGRLRGRDRRLGGRLHRRGRRRRGRGGAGRARAGRERPVAHRHPPRPRGRPAGRARDRGDRLARGASPTPVRPARGRRDRRGRRRSRGARRAARSTPGSSPSGGAAPAVLLLLPGLVAFAAAVGASRLLPAAGRLLARSGLERRPARGRLGRAVPRRRRDRRGVPGARRRPCASRRGVSLDAAHGRGRPGGLRRAGGRRRPRGSPLARAGAPCGAARPVRLHSRRRRRVPRPPCLGERGPVRVDLGRHRARASPGCDPRDAALAG